MTFHGANAIIGTYNLSLQGNQSSLSQVWLQSGQSTELNSIQVGTGVGYFLLCLCQTRFFCLMTL